MSKEVNKPTLTSFAKEMNKAYGEGSLMAMEEKPTTTYLQTGVFPIDFALLGGIPENRFSLLVGERSSGKSTVSYKIMASAQRKYPDKQVVLADLEDTFDPVWAAANGVDVSRVFLLNMPSHEDIADAAAAALMVQDCSLVVFDSLAVISTTKDETTSLADAVVATRAKLISRMMTTVQTNLRKAGMVEKRPVTFLGINQFRLQVGSMFSDPRILPGGKAQEYAASAVIELRKKKDVVGRDEFDLEHVAYNEHAFSIKKMKQGNSTLAGEFQMIRDPNYEFGASFIDDARTLMVMAQSYGIMQGKTLTYTDHPKFGKQDDFYYWLYSNPYEHDKLRAILIALRRRQNKQIGLPVDGFLYRDFTGLEIPKIEAPGAK